MGLQLPVALWEMPAIAEEALMEALEERDSYVIWKE